MYTYTKEIIKCLLIARTFKAFDEIEVYSKTYLCVGKTLPFCCRQSIFRTVKKLVISKIYCLATFHTWTDQFVYLILHKTSLALKVRHENYTFVSDCCPAGSTPTKGPTPQCSPLWWPPSAATGCRKERASAPTTSTSSNGSRGSKSSGITTHSATG